MSRDPSLCASSLTAESQQLAEQSAPVVSGIAAVRHYIAMRDKMPLLNLGGSVHAIHGGTEYGAEIAFDDLKALLSSHEALVKALETFVEEYTQLVNSGDAGFWDPETEPKVIAARAALASAREVQP